MTRRKQSFVGSMKEIRYPHSGGVVNMEVDCVFLGNFANGIIVQMSHDMAGLAPAMHSYSNNTSHPPSKK